MKVKTSITLSAAIVKALDGLGREFKNRSQAVEKAVLFYTEHRRRIARDAHDRAIIAKKYRSLTAEALDTLEYQEEA